MTLDQQWEALKPQIIALLEEGWSRPLVFRRLKISNNSKVYEMCYRQDREFLELIKKYRQTARGFYHKILSEKNTKR